MPTLPQRREAAELQRGMNEAAHKRDLVAGVKALPGGYARRLEDRFAVGLLDLLIKLPGYPLVFAEGKLVEAQSFGPTERQYEEGKRIQAAGLNALLIGWKGKTMAVSPWVGRTKWDECFRGLDHYSTLEGYLRFAGYGGSNESR